MADFYAELVTYLKTDAGVTALVGSGTAARIFPEVPKQGASLPFLVIQEGGGGVSFEHLSGASGLAEGIFHVLAYGSTRSSADGLSEAVRLAGPMQGYRGLMGSTYARVTAPIHRDVGVDSPTDKQSHNRYWVRTVYSIYHDQATS